MAHIDSIWMHGSDKGKGTISINVKLKPSGTDRIEVLIPADFHDCLLSMAQAAADLHEQKMRAQILADQAVESGE